MPWKSDLGKPGLHLYVLHGNYWDLNALASSLSYKRLPITSLPLGGGGGLPTSLNQRPQQLRIDPITRGSPMCSSASVARSRLVKPVHWRSKLKTLSEKM